MKFRQNLLFRVSTFEIGESPIVFQSLVCNTTVSFFPIVFHGFKHLELYGCPSVACFPLPQVLTFLANIGRTHLGMR